MSTTHYVSTHRESNWRCCRCDGEFCTFWQRYEGVRVFGLPLSEDYNGVSPEDGKMYKMQLFERARLEMHPDAPAGQRVQLALLGAEELRLRTHFVQEGGPPQGQ